MKAIFLSFGLFCGLLASAQEKQGHSTEATNAPGKEGKIVYERTMQFQRPQGMPEEVAARIPASRTDVYEVLFGNNQSLWRSVPRVDGDNGNITGPGMVMRTVGFDDVIYFNFATGQRVDKREVMDNDFIVLDSVRRLKWKLGEETKMILGYTAHKATAQRYGQRRQMVMENGEMKRTTVPDTSLITAWYTTAFPVSVGPQEYQGQLPGIVLEVEVNNGRLFYKAVELSNKVSLSSIKEPKGGKRVTPDEFEAESRRLADEMRKNLPPGAQIRIQN